MQKANTLRQVGTHAFLIITFAREYTGRGRSNNPNVSTAPAEAAADTTGRAAMEQKPRRYPEFGPDETISISGLF